MGRDLTSVRWIAAKTDWEFQQVWTEDGENLIAETVIGVKNADLIAAAPELLKSLQSVKTYLEDCLCDRQQIGLPSRTAYDQVCAAIAKATAE